MATTALKNGILDSSKVRDILLNGFYYFSGNNLLDGYFRELWRKFFVTHEYYNLAAGLGGLFGVLPAMCFYINEYSYVKKAKEQAVKVITEGLGEPLDPKQNPILQMVELLLIEEGGDEPAATGGPN